MTGPAPLRVAAVQAESVSGDVPVNVATAVTWVRAATDRGARVVVLPELFVTGYDPDHWDASLVGVDDARMEPLRDAAREHAVQVVAGAAVRRPAGHNTLSLLVFDDEGTVRAAYDKQHLFAAERSFFTAGEQGASLRVDGWELGLGICYDGCFPAHATAAAVDGALAYLCPSAYYQGSEHRRDLYYRARALDNGIYVVLSGLVGRCGRYSFSGGSAVLDPEGRPVATADDGPGMVVAELDAAVVADAQQRNPLLRDRVDVLGTRVKHTLGSR